MSQEQVIHGRPDFGNIKFGVTRVKKHPKYIYANQQGMLIHEIAYAELRWYKIGGRGDYLIRRTSPRIGFTTKCGMYMFGPDPDDKKQHHRSTVCEMPKPDAVLCNRCQGKGTTFAKGNKPKPGGPTRQEARARLGCVIESSLQPEP